eukprot:TRINITY_DN4327_c2_g1_i2.p1 TRINITY_DN4327_c2_g1~~TRINITY_DN4327_c2_g1_i2.p1  ORF type:complete len:359 (+),score=36.05 TRINITY_DN4327_c2_g1_i2:125-1201(+)
MTLSVLVATLMAKSALLPWLYQDVEERGPPFWGTMRDLFEHEIYPSCAGTSQSPVSIYNTIGEPSLHALEFEYLPVVDYNISNTQYGIKVELEKGTGGGILEGNQAGKRYNLTSIEVHVPAEHTIGGSQYDMEVQLQHTAVPQSEDGISFNQTRVIVSILFMTKGGKNPVLNFLEEAPGLPLPDFEYYKDAGVQYTFNLSQVRTGSELDGNKMIIDGSYYTYIGSDTKPPCEDNVKWFVMSKENRMSAGQLTGFRDLMMFDAAEAAAVAASATVSSSATITGNARPSQPLNGRTVASFITSPRPIAMYSDDDDDAYVLGLIGTVVSCTTLCFLILFILIRRRSTSGPSANGTNPDHQM